VYRQQAGDIVATVGAFADTRRACTTGCRGLLELRHKLRPGAVRRMIRHESVITALIGAALGLPLGVLLAAILTRGLSSQGVSFHLPLTQLVIFTFVAVIAGISAAVLPARRASRLNVLTALQYE